jgi:hypothetical protein
MRIPRQIALTLAGCGVLAGGLVLPGAAALAAGPPEKPVTEAATAVRGTTAVLHGKLNPHVAASTGWHFDYSPEASCTGGPGASTTGFEAETAGASTDEPEQSEVGGLIPNQTYAFCFVATHTEGETTESTLGDPLTFTTAGVPPAVEGLTTSNVRPSTVTLEAQVNPENTPTSCKFEYGTTPAANEQSMPCEPAATLEGHESQHASVAVSGLLAATKYHYRLLVHNSSGEPTPDPEGEFTTVGGPTATTGAAQFPTRTSIVLAGTVNPGGAETTYQWVYISQARYEAALANAAEDPYVLGSSTPPAKIGPSYEPQTLAPHIAGELLPDTTYHYALIASNEAGTALGQDATFTTGPGTPPLVSTTGSSASGPTTATITGTINTRGLQTNYGFQIGTEAGNYGPATGLGTIGAGAIEANVTLGLQNLVPGTTYHYRLVGTNEDGTQDGADQTFATPVVTNPLAQPIASPVISTPAIAFPTASTSLSTTKKTLTKAQQLANALQACSKKPKSKRASCQRQARKKYGAKPKPKAKAKQVKPKT